MRTRHGLYSQSGIEQTKSIPSLDSNEQELLSYIRFHGLEDFINSLKLIHDMALYHTDVCLDTTEKSALFDLKILWEGLESFRQKMQ